MKATILTTAAVGLLLAPLTVCHAETAAVGKPNILLLFADDLGRYASAYADPALPSLRRLRSSALPRQVARVSGDPGRATAASSCSIVFRLVDSTGRCDRFCL